MATREKKGGGDFVLESRHLVGLFLLLVVIFGVVFTLGYLLGRNQSDSMLRVAGKSTAAETSAAAMPAKPKAKPETDDAQPVPEKSDWDFYHSAEPQATQDHLQPPPKPAEVSSVPPRVKQVIVPKKSPAPEKASPSANGPLIPKGAIMLQVAALDHQDDALALAQALQQKKFPAFVITPGADHFYRVQVGPYPDALSATKARNKLEADGFMSIVKR